MTYGAPARCTASLLPEAAQKPLSSEQFGALGRKLSPHQSAKARMGPESIPTSGEEVMVQLGTNRRLPP